MTVAELLEEFHGSGIRVWIDSDKLRCSAPDDVPMDSALELLARRKAEIIEYLSGPAPLSFSQERFWLLSKAGAGDHVIPIMVTLEGALDVSALERSIEFVLRRHSGLRTVFVEDADVPLQVIRGLPKWRLPVVNADGLDEAGLMSLLEHEVGRPFDLESGPLFRAMLCRAAEEHHVLLLAAHHIVADGWSVNVLLQDLTEIYNAITGDRQPDLKELAIEYPEVARRQRLDLNGDATEVLLAHWRQALAGAPHVLDLPTDHARAEHRSHRGGSCTFSVPADLTESLRQFARREQVTLYMVLVSAYVMMLSRYSGQSDLLIGTPVANRDSEDVANVVGCFINTVILRADLSDDPTLADLIRRMRGTCLDAFANADLPLERLVEELQPRRDAGRNALFQVLFDYQGTPSRHLNLDGLTSTVDMSIGVVNTFLDLDWGVEDTDAGLKCNIDYAADLFDESTILQMAGHWRAMLEACLDRANEPVSSIEIMSAEEHGLLAKWGTGTRVDGGEPPAHRMFEMRARERPEAIAIRLPDADLTYGSLDAMANRVASRLRELGAGKGTIVGLYMERSPELIAAMLGVLKAGAAYLPLDPEYPADRIEFMINDSGTQLVVVGASTDLRVDGNPRLFEFAALDHGAIRSEPPGPDVSATDCAYVIYTSGSTGVPKGVAVQHRALAALVQSAVELYELDGSDRVLQFSTPSFDASVEEIFGSLAAGSELVFRSDDMLASADAFWAACESWGITVVNLPTAFWHGLVAEEQSHVPDCVRRVIIGGEQALRSRVDQWLSRMSDHVELINGYGPTETTVTATAWKARADGFGTFPDTPIGRPMAHVSTYVLDRHGRRVPRGVVGELWIGGPAVALGYLNRPDATADRFWPDPFAGRNGARMYRTGDLARLDANGLLYFVGRADNQIKLRGYRIEPGEIESALEALEEIRQAVVVVVGEAEARRLVAYVVGMRETPDAGDIRGVLAQRLPPHMVPSIIMPLEAMPRLPNGKVDRKSLPTPIIGERTFADRFSEPAGETECTIADVWQEVLGVERVSRDSNFFDLGGHSLLAMQVIARLKRRGVDVAARTLFTTPDLKALAHWVDVSHALEPQAAEVRIDDRPTEITC